MQLFSSCRKISVHDKTKELLPQLFEYAKQEHYIISGEPIEFCHIDDYETNNESEYLIELQLPVE